MIELKEKPIELVDADDIEDLLWHMARKVNSLSIKIPEDFFVEVYKDMSLCLKREFGITSTLCLEKRHLYTAHEVIDDYQLPTVILEKIEEQTKRGAHNEVV